MKRLRIVGALLAMAGAVSLLLLALPGCRSRPAATPPTMRQQCMWARLNCANRLAGCDLPRSAQTVPCDGVKWHPRTPHLRPDATIDVCNETLMCWGELRRLRGLPYILQDDEKWIPSPGLDGCDPAPQTPIAPLLGV